MNSNAIINTNTVRTLERSILVGGSVVLLSATLLLISTGLSHYHRLESAANLAMTKQQIRTLSDTLDKAKRIKVQPNTQKELNIVQETMDRLAAQHSCQIQEVTSTNDTVQMLTHYKKGMEEKGWKQVAISGQVVGSLSNVMAFTRSLSLISVPLEITSIAVTPMDSKSSGGLSKVSAKFNIQILKQEGTR